MRVVGGLLFLILVAAGLSGCGTIPVPTGYSKAFRCQQDLRVPGEYRVPTGSDTPTVEPGRGGTQAGADALNACIRATPPLTDGGGLPSVAPQVPGNAPTRDYFTACLFEVNATGSYVTRGSSTVPTVRRGGGGTQEGADAINACIQRKAAEDGVLARQGGAATTTIETQLTDVAGVPQQVTTTTSGLRTTDTFTYGTPPGSAFAGGDLGRQHCNLRMVGGTGYSCTR